MSKKKLYKFQYLKTQKNVLGNFSLALAVFAAIGVSIAFAQSDNKGEMAGLGDILPAEVPEAVSFDAFAELDGNWESWSEEVAGLVTDFYDNRSADAATERETIAVLRRKQAVMEKAMKDRSYRSILIPLLDLQGGLDLRLDVAEAILDSLATKPEDAKKALVADAANTLQTAVDDVKADLSGIPNGESWFGYLNVNNAADLDKAALSSLAAKLSDPSKLTKDQQEFLDRVTIQSYLSAVKNKRDALNFSAPKADLAKQRATYKELVAAIENYDSTSSTVSAQKIIELLKKLEKETVDGGKYIKEVIFAHFQKTNLRVNASEEFLSRLIKDRLREDGPVVDFILGANVRGNQTTYTDVDLDLLPAEKGARFAITIDGTVNSTTRGTTSQATIFTNGRHRFNARKEITYNGVKFATRPASINVTANNTTTGASTQYNRVPLLGGIARNIAVREANRRRGASQRIAESRVRERVLPKFNKEVNNTFSDANQRLESDVRSRLQEMSLMPDREYIKTSGNDLYYAARVAGHGELSGGTRADYNLPSAGMIMNVHESLLNNAIDRMSIAGKVMTEDELKKAFEDALERILQRDVDFDRDSPASDKDAAEKSEAKDDAAFIFDEHDPIRFQFRDGLIYLIVKTGFRRKGEEDIPKQVVTVPVSLTINDGKIIVKRGTVKVQPVEDPGSPAVQVANAGVIRGKIQQSLPERTRDNLFKVKRQQGGTFDMVLDSAEPSDGWLTLRMQ